MIQPKFQIGQKVICVRVNWLEEKVPCPDCLGKTKWRIITPAGEEWEHDCNTCRNGWYSTGVVSDYRDRVKKEILTIGSIRIDTADKDRPISYMCVETGVGSGSVYDEQNMFATDEEATAWGEAELERVKGLRQAEELKKRAHKKKDSIYKPRKAK